MLLSWCSLLLGSAALDTMRFELNVSFVFLCRHS